MQLSTARRGGRLARRGAKGWFVWRAAKAAVPRRRRDQSTRTVVGAFGLGAGSGILLSKLDKRRRHVARDRAAASARDVAEASARKADYAAGVAKGAAHGVTSPLRGEREYDDVTLARKVETEIFRPADAPKGAVSVSVVDGVVELRGQLDDAEQIQALAEQAKRVEGVKDVRNLLHKPS
jgi:osmotically-inducible protein OsmY